MRTLTATELRGNLYRLLDEVASTGRPIRVEREAGAVLLTPADGPRRKLDELPLRPVTKCTPDELVETSFPWTPGESE